MTAYTNRGILSTAPWRGSAVGSFSAGDYVENGFALWADSYDNQPEADRAAHRAVPIQAALTLSGSLESVVITVNVRGIKKPGEAISPGFHNFRVTIPTFDGFVLCQGFELPLLRTSFICA